MKPIFNGGRDAGKQTAGHVFQRQSPGHVRRVDGSERKPVTAKFAVLFSGISHPLHEAFLVNPFYGPGTNARVKQRTFRQSFGTTHPANVGSAVVVHLQKKINNLPKVIRFLLCISNKERAIFKNGTVTY